jgi:tetratricopeptide (TPR) repeat protein
MNRLKDARVYAAAALFLAAFFIYLRTLCPSVYFGDSGELISMIYTLGIPHPTGFSLYILLGKIFSFLPLANTAFKINLLSAFFAALVPAALFFVFHMLVRKEQNALLRIALPLAAASVFIFSYTLWSQAVVARIYSLNALLCALALACFMYYREVEPEDRALYLLAFVTGLGAGLHLSLIMFCVFLWLYLAVKNTRALRRMAAPLLFFLIAGLSIDLYIIIRGRADLVLKWQKLDNFGDFFSYITQQQYRRKMLTRTPQEYTVFFGYMKDVVAREFSGTGLFAFIFAAAWAIQNKFKYVWLFLAIFFSNILLLAAYGTYADMNLAFRYMIPSYMIECFFFFMLGYYVFRNIRGWQAAAAATLAIFTVILLSCAGRNYYENDRSCNYIAYNYPHDMLDPLPQKSYVFISGDNQIYTIAYSKFVEGRYKDIVIYDTINTIFRDIETLRDESKSDKPTSNMITAFMKKLSPVYTATDVNFKGIGQSLSGYLLRENDGPAVPDLLYPWKLYPLRGIVRDAGIYRTFEEREVAGFYLFKLGDYYKKTGNMKLYSYLYEKAAEAGYDSPPLLGNLAIRYGSDASDLPDGPQKAEELFNKALSLNPENDQMFLNAGSFYARIGVWAKAAEYFDKAIALNPANIAARIYRSRVQDEIDKAASYQNQLKEKTAHFDAGRKLLDEKQFDQAMEEFNKDIELNPNSDRSYFHVGLIYSIKGDMAKDRSYYQKAIPFYEKAAGINPRDIAAINNLGLCYIITGDKSKARAAFEQSLQINPDQDRIKKMMEKLKQ